VPGKGATAALRPCFIGKQLHSTYEQEQSRPSYLRRKDARKTAAFHGDAYFQRRGGREGKRGKEALEPPCFTLLLRTSPNPAGFGAYSSYIKSTGYT